MSRSKPYHHGQLRETLLQALLTLAQDIPLAQISLREVAKKAGVSHAAPYHHFESKEAMIEAATLECLRNLSHALTQALAALPEHTLRCTKSPPWARLTSILPWNGPRSTSSSTGPMCATSRT